MHYRILGIILLSVVAVSASAQQQPKEWTLQECIDYAIQNNLSIKRQEDIVKQQEITLNTSQYSRLPNLSASVSQNFNFGRALTVDNIYENRNTQSTAFGLSTSAPLITGGQLYHEVKLNRLNLQAAIQDCQRTRESVVLNVISFYLETVCQKDLVEIARNQVELSEAQVQRVRELFDNGKASGADLAQIQAAHSSDQFSLTQQENAFMLARLNLAQLMELTQIEGFDVIRPVTPEGKASMLPSPEVVYAEALGIRPQIVAEELRLQSAERAVLRAKSGLYPSLYFNAGIGTNYYNTSGYYNPTFAQQMRDNFSQYIGFSLNVPIFNRLATRNSIRMARVQVHTQTLQLEESKKALFKEIQQAYYNAVASEKQCLSSSVALESAKASFELTSKKFENGKANTTEYQESKISMAKAQSNMMQSRYTLLLRLKILDFYRGQF